MANRYLQYDHENKTTLGRITAVKNEFAAETTELGLHELDVFLKELLAFLSTEDEKTEQKTAPIVERFYNRCRNYGVDIYWTLKVYLEELPYLICLEYNAKPEIVIDQLTQTEQEVGQLVKRKKY